MKHALQTLFISAVAFTACNNAAKKTTTGSTAIEPPAAVATGDSLPAPYATDTVRNNSTVVGWPEGKTPQAPSGLYRAKIRQRPEESPLDICAAKRRHPCGRSQ